MPNTINPRPLDAINKELMKAGFDPKGSFIRLIRDLATRADKTLTDNGEIKAEANVTGRTEPLSTTVTNITSAGLLSSADKVAADGSTFGRVAITALTSNQPDLSKTGVINKTAANISETSNLKWRTAAHSTTQPVNIVITGTDAGGGHATVTYSAFTQRVPGLSDYTVPAFIGLNQSNSQKYYLYGDDPNFDGSGSFFLLTDPFALFLNSGRMYLGNVTTPAPLGAPTTGNEGGTGGSRDINLVIP